MRRTIRVISGLVLLLAVVAAQGCVALEWEGACDERECAWSCIRAGYSAGVCSSGGCECLATPPADAGPDGDVDADADPDADSGGWECVEWADCEGSPSGHDCQSSLDPDTGLEVRRCGCSGRLDCASSPWGGQCLLGCEDQTPYEGLSSCGCVTDLDCLSNRFTSRCALDPELGVSICGGAGECLGTADCVENPTSLGPRCSPENVCECDPARGDADCTGNPNGQFCVDLGDRNVCSCRPGIAGECVYPGSAGDTCAMAPYGVETFVCQ